MTNGDRIRQMTDEELEELAEYGIIYPYFSPNEIRKSDNKFLSVMLDGCCLYCSELDNSKCSQFCVKNILEYLDSEV